MLYNVIICVLLAYVVVSPVFYAKALKFGIKIAQDPEEAAKEAIMDEFRVPEKKEPPKMTAEENRSVQILANIDRYDGTSAGQKKVVVENKG